MNYRCPQCKNGLPIHKLFFSDISACKSCGQRVVLGDALGFFIAAMTMMVSALTALYKLSYSLQDDVIAGGYSIAIGMLSGVVVLLLLGRAMPYKRIGRARTPPPQAEAKP
jgi:DNA-directed RNA polymerase subunit RPC12/RpoP